MAKQKAPQTESETRKAMRKYAAAERARLALRHQFERIDLHEDVIKPRLEAIKSGKVDIDLDPGDVLEIEA